MTKEAIYKIEMLLEDDDIINDAQQAFNSYISKNPSEEDAKKGLSFLFKNNIEPKTAETTLANMASGVGKKMDSNEALKLYNKAEHGQNTNPNNYALQNFFERTRTSDVPEIDSLVHGIGKNPSTELKDGLLKALPRRFMDKGLPDEDMKLATRLFREKYQQDWDKMEARGKHMPLWQILDKQKPADDWFTPNSAMGIDDKLLRERIQAKYGDDPVENYADKYLKAWIEDPEEYNRLSKIFIDFRNESSPVEGDERDLETRFEEIYPEEAAKLKEFDKTRSEYATYNTWKQEAAH